MALPQERTQAWNNGDAYPHHKLIGKLKCLRRWKIVKSPVYAMTQLNIVHTFGLIFQNSSHNESTTDKPYFIAGMNSPKLKMPSTPQCLCSEMGFTFREYSSALSTGVESANEAIAEEAPVAAVLLHISGLRPFISL